MHPGYAATNLQGDTGPGGFQEQRGHAAPAPGTAAAQDADTARRPWELSEGLIGVSYPLTRAAAG